MTRHAVQTTSLPLLVHVDAPYFCAGVIVDDDGVIVEAAPILRWAIGKRIEWFRDYVASKGWVVA